MAAGSVAAGPSGRTGSHCRRCWAHLGSLRRCDDVRKRPLVVQYCCALRTTRPLTGSLPFCAQLVSVCRSVVGRYSARGTRSQMRAPRSSAAAAPCALPVPAANRSSKRVSGGDPLDNPRLRDFLNRCGQCCPWLFPVSVSSPPAGALSFVCSPLPRLRRNTREFDAEGRVLRLKRFIPADCRPQVLDAVLDALTENTRVEVLYIQNFEQGFGDDQLLRLLDVLKLGRIWAVNVGENFQTSLPTWREFAAGLKDTDVQYMCVASCARSVAPADVLFCAPQVRVRAPLPAHRPEDPHAGRHPGEPPRAEARPRPGGHPLCGQHVVQSEGGGCEGGASQHGG